MKATAPQPEPPTLRRRLVRQAAEAMLPSSMLVMRGETVEKKVSLTFDDGPERLLDRYLDVLDRYGVRATFFVLGKCCAERRDELLEIVRRGHEVASHGYSHLRFTRMTRPQLLDELERTAELLPVPRAVRPLVRPPQGATSLRSLLRTSVMGFTTVLWSLDSDDCRTSSWRAVAETCAPERVQPGEIVLLHEGQEWTVEALPAILDGLLGAGHSLVTVGDLLRG